MASEIRALATSPPPAKPASAVMYELVDFKTARAR
jgi:hypothetical protein